MKTDYKGIF